MSSIERCKTGDRGKITHLADGGDDAALRSSGVSAPGYRRTRERGAAQWRGGFSLVELPVVSRRERAAFSLVELIVVIGIIAGALAFGSQLRC